MEQLLDHRQAHEKLAVFQPKLAAAQSLAQCSHLVVVHVSNPTERH